MLLKYDPGEEDDDEETEDSDEEMEEFEESEEDDEDDDTDELDRIQYSLLEVLDERDQDWTWASHGPVMANLPFPGLHLSEGGVVGLPLSSMDALRIKQHALQLGSKMNSGADNDDLTCDLDPSQFELRNCTWHDAAQAVALGAIRAFDLRRADIRLRNLTLSSPSRPLHILQAPNPDSAAFGSLMIVLPSLHQGGNIKLTYDDETKEVSTAITSEFDYSFVAWFSDVQLELKPISSGYRLHIMYDLYEPADHARRYPSASAILDEATAYQRMLEQWSELRENRGLSNPLVFYNLENNEGDYGEPRLSYDALRQGHRLKAKFLQQQCIKSKVCLWLARLSSSIDTSRIGGPEPIFQLDRITKLDGTIVVNGTITIGKEDIVELDSFERRGAYQGDLAERSVYGGNLYRFKDKVFLLLPESQEMQFLADNMSAEEILQWMGRRSSLIQSSRTQAEDIAQETSREEQRKELAFVCQRIISMERSRRRNEEDSWLFRPGDRMFKLGQEELVRSTLVARQVDLFGAAVTEYPRELPPAIWREIGKEFNYNDVLHGGYKERLAMALSKIPTLHTRQINLDFMLSGYDQDTVKPDDDIFKVWARENIVSALSTYRHDPEDDDRALAAIERLYGKDILKERKSDK